MGPLLRNRLLIFLALMLVTSLARAADLRVGFVPVDGAFPLVSNTGTPASIYADPSDLQPTGIAAHLLADDIVRVTNHTPNIVDNEAQLSPAAVVIGTIGHSRIIDELIAAGKLNVSELQTHSEAYLLQVLDHPLPGINKALVIVGSDRRGTAYGVTTLSARLGISPWYWWANVPVVHRDSLYVNADDYTDGSPVVRYRGIFLNDEAPSMSGWANQQFGGFNSKMYAHVFELLLRLRANYLWPAMWGEAFNEDDPANAQLANDYGIVMGTSHQEPMMRAQAEWDRRHGNAEWNFAKDPAGLESFWREGIKRNKNYDNLITIGMRGRNDTPMIQGASVQQSIDLLEKIVLVQRKIIADEINPDVTQVPQVWCLYKEVQSYYEKGMRVPDDVTLLWSDDNWGNLRRLPTASERHRPGGAGIYYHFDYVGDPRNYKWINTNPITKVWEQMSLAHAYGADRIWIVNVGDLKPMEYPISFFLDMAWNPAAMTRETLADYGHQWASQQFGEDHSKEIADLIAWYTRINGRRKPELLTDEPYSVTNYHEAQDMLADCQAMSSKADALAKLLPTNTQDAYFQLVQHPVQATAIVNELYIEAALNQLYASQGNSAANDAADQVQRLFQADIALSDRYNHGIAGGFWNHMMDQTHIGYTSWQQPAVNIMPSVRRVNPTTGPTMAVAIEGGRANLPTFDSFNRQTRTIHVYNRGSGSFNFEADADQPWAQIHSFSAKVDKDQPVAISLDWAHVPRGQASATLNIHGAGMEPVRVKILANNPERPTRDDLDGFAEDAGIVSIQASHYSREVDAADGTRWERIDDLGLTGSAMMPSPSTALTVMPTGSRSAATLLEYRIWISHPGPSTVTTIVSPTQAFVPGRGLRYAIGFDDQPLQVIDTLMGQTRSSWEKSVPDGVRQCTSSHALDLPGYHTLKIYCVDPALVLQKIVVDLGGLQPSYLGPPESFHRHTH